PTLEEMVKKKPDSVVSQNHMMVYFLLVIVILAGLRFWLYMTVEEDNVPQMLIDIFDRGFNIFTILILVIQVLHQRQSNKIMIKQLNDYRGQNDMMAYQLELQQMQFVNQLSS